MAARVPTPHLSRPSGYEENKAVNLPKPYKLRRFYTPSEVTRHNTHSDCWVSFFYGVYDLTKLLADNRNKQSALCVPIGNASGNDITHWFDPLTQEVSLFLFQVEKSENAAIKLVDTWLQVHIIYMAH